MFTFELTTDANGAFDIMSHLQEALSLSKVEVGLAVIQVPHTTAGVAIVAFPDPLVLDDLTDEINRLVPTRVDFRHQYDTPQDAAGHIKAALFGSSLTLIISASSFVLGHSQRVYFMEYDGPRRRRFHIEIMGLPK